MVERMFSIHEATGSIPVISILLSLFSFFHFHPLLRFSCLPPSSLPIIPYPPLPSPFPTLLSQASSSLSLVSFLTYASLPPHSLSSLPCPLAGTPAGLHAGISP